MEHENIIGAGMGWLEDHDSAKREEEYREHMASLGYDVDAGNSVDLGVVKGEITSNPVPSGVGMGWPEAKDMRRGK